MIRPRQTRPPGAAGPWVRALASLMALAGLAGLAGLVGVTALAGPTGVAGVLGPTRAAAQGAGSGATTILRIAPGPRPLALGNAYAAVAEPGALEYNPAGATGGGVAASYQSLPVDASAGSALLTLPWRGATVGLSLRFVDYGEVDVIEPDGSRPVGRPTGETATGGELSALVGGAIPVGPVRLGAAGRWLRQDVAGLTDDAWAVDLGALLDITDRLSLGAAVQHLGPDVEAGRPAPLPRTVRLGAASRTRLRGLDVLVTAEARSREDRTGGGAGVELVRGWDDGEAALRVGYETRPSSGDAYAPLVVGGAVRLGPLGVELAWRSLGVLGSTRQLGVRYRF